MMDKATPHETAIEHGGDLDRAIALYGGARKNWIDLSTGINPHVYPLPQIEMHHFAALPDAGVVSGLIDAAKDAYRTEADCLPVAGAQQAIQLYPALLREQLKGRSAAVLAASYNEHGIQLRRQGWKVETVQHIAGLAGADLAVLVNPNNPDGQYLDPQGVRDLARQVGFLVVDESFCDIRPELSLCPHLEGAPDNILILRSFGKFYGLAGLRLGFMLGAPELIERAKAMLGSWPVSGPALAVGTIALSDRKWATDMIAQLDKDASRLDRMAEDAGWQLVGGTSLFRLYDVADGAECQAKLAVHHIWSRKFGYAPSWLRLGLPGLSDWNRLEQAIGAIKG